MVKDTYKVFVLSCVGASTIAHRVLELVISVANYSPDTIEACLVLGHLPMCHLEFPRLHTPDNFQQTQALSYSSLRAQISTATFLEGVFECDFTLCTSLNQSARV